jgi:hypothetical protein
MMVSEEKLSPNSPDARRLQEEFFRHVQRTPIELFTKLGKREQVILTVP